MSRLCWNNGVGFLKLDDFHLPTLSEILGRFFEGLFCFCSVIKNVVVVDAETVNDARFVSFPTAKKSAAVVVGAKDAIARNGRYVFHKSAVDARKTRGNLPSVFSGYGLQFLDRISVNDLEARVERIIAAKSNFGGLGLAMDFCDIARTIIGSQNKVVDFHNDDDDDGIFIKVKPQLPFSSLVKNSHHRIQRTKWHCH